VTTANCHHRAVVTGGKHPDDLPQFRWINTLLGNLKTSFSGTFHAFNFDKYARRYRRMGRFHGIVGPQGGAQAKPKGGRWNPRAGFHVWQLSRTHARNQAARLTESHASGQPPIERSRQGGQHGRNCHSVKSSRRAHRSDSQATPSPFLSR